MFHVIIEPSPDELPFKSARLTDVKVRSLDAAAALLHVLSQTIESEDEILSIKLLNSKTTENETQKK